MNNLIMLDTCGYSLFKRGNQEVLELIRQAQEIRVPSIVIGELLGGFERGSKKEQNRQELTSFLESPRVEAVDITELTAERYAHIYTYLRSAGNPIPINDLWIAASAMEYSATLITSDKHFQKIPHILISFITS